MAQVYRDALIKEFRRHLRCRMALVMGGVVDQYVSGAVHGRDRRDRAFERRDVTDIGFDITDAGRFTAKLRGERLRRLARNVDEADFRLLADKGAHDRSADARAAAGDDYRLAREIRIDRARGSLHHVPCSL